MNAIPLPLLPVATQPASTSSRLLSLKQLLLVALGSGLLVLALWFLSGWYWFGINMSQSLPYHVVIIDKKWTTLTRGDFVVFVPRPSEFSAQFRGIQFFKQVDGVAGDTVQRDYRNISINGRYVGFAMTRTLRGNVLNPIDAQIIPAGMVYVRGDHPQSFDSRYQECGLVGQEQIVGKAHVLF